MVAGEHGPFEIIGEDTPDLTSVCCNFIVAVGLLEIHIKTGPPLPTRPTF